MAIGRGRRVPGVRGLAVLTLAKGSGSDRPCGHILSNGDFGASALHAEASGTGW